MTSRPGAGVTQAPVREEGGAVRTTRPPRARVLGTVLVAAALAAGVATAAPAAGNPACGSLLTTDTVLTGDLVCTAGPAVRLAPGVSLDLGGYTVRGSRYQVGVLVPQGGDVEIRNGVITGWGTGVRAEPGTSGTLTLRDVHLPWNFVSASTAPLDKAGQVHLVVERARVDGSARLPGGFYAFNGGGLTVTDSRLVRGSVACSTARCTVRRVELVGGAIRGGPGLVATDNVMLGNSADGGTYAVVVGSGAGGGPRSVVARNSVRNYAAGVEVDRGVDVVVEDNALLGNGTGLTLWWDVTGSVRRNLLADNHTGLLDRGGAVRVRDNVVVANRDRGVAGWRAAELRRQNVVHGNGDDR